MCEVCLAVKLMRNTALLYASRMVLSAAGTVFDLYRQLVHQFNQVREAKNFNFIRLEETRLQFIPTSVLEISRQPPVCTFPCHYIFG